MALAAPQLEAVQCRANQSEETSQSLCRIGETGGEESRADAAGFRASVRGAGRAEATEEAGSGLWFKGQLLTCGDEVRDSGAAMVMAAKKGPGPGGGVGGGKAEAEAASEVWCRRVRELGGCSQAGNRHCFECAQRGVTYVDITVGSFVCTTCSGLL